LPETFPAVPEETSTAVAVTRVVPAGNERLAGFHITCPQAGSSERVYSLPIEGWVVPAHAAAREVEIQCGERPLMRVPVAIERPDVAALHPDLPWAGRGGFAVRLNAVTLPPRFRLTVSVLHGDGDRTRLGTIEGERRPLPMQEPAYQPLVVTTLGRSGSTWLTWLLGRHPEIADYRSFEYESKVGPYFAEVLAALTQPASYYQPIRGEIDNRGWWQGRERNWSLAWHSSHDSIDEWLGSEYVESLVEFFAGRVDALFGRLAEALGKEDASYVVEKMPPAYFGRHLLAELFPGMREVFLVRDFRDVACSIFAFGDKRSRRWYANREVMTEEQCIREILRDEALALLEAWSERSEAAHLVRYEDLVLRPYEVLPALFAYLGVDASAETVSHVLSDSARLDPGLQDMHRTSATAEDSVGRWRRDLDPSLVRVCEEELRHALGTFGYPAAGLAS
jgi:hypothetical protein